MSVDAAVVEWSRAQFALTAMFHWIFVPLTLGLSFIVAIMESIYVRTGDPEWKRITRFWMKLFAVNFAIGVATGLILEFEFGTNWSNYSWMVGDIFGAPLAIEGIFAFFLEATFFAVMFFGWERVSKRFHLTSTWLVAIGSNLSALWILVANGWMQHPVGMRFNIETARNEMVDFWEVLLNPNAVTKFLHTVSSGYVLAALFVIAVSAWFILKKRDLRFAKRSLLVAASFGLLSSGYLVLLGDGSAFVVAHDQPAKLAAMEGVYDGASRKGIVLFGVLDPDKELGDGKDPFIIKIEMSQMLSLLGFHDIDSFVPGAEDLVFGNAEHGIESAADKLAKGKVAVDALAAFHAARKRGDPGAADQARADFDAHADYLGYGYLDKPEDILPPIPLTFYSFHIMVGLGFWFVLLFVVLLWFQMTGEIADHKNWLRLGILSLPLGYLAEQTGWIVAEVGRQPWAIQDMLPVGVATSDLDAASVSVTFWIFLVLFTALLIAEVRIMLGQIRRHGEEVGHV
ncbi:MAG: cytochrome ubiquinol oxidase subunit I [Deltaproteobacteria bacterium]|nr:MAG: cytochrome ubiquinol oxidase subunit I [Deltaproteobacteria bacterium]